MHRVYGILLIIIIQSFRVRKPALYLLRFALLLAALLVIMPASAQRKKVGVVLSGGGAKGVAHINALKVIEEAGIPIDYIAGTSMGAIIGGLYAVGYDTHTLDSMVRTQDWMALLSDQISRRDMVFGQKEAQERYLLTVALTPERRFQIPTGLLAGQNVYNLFTEMTIGYHDSLSFRELPVPFACVSYDLVTGRSVVMDSGFLPQAMRASMAIPGAFEPVRLGDMLLIDGGISNNFPADVVKDMGAEIIIGVDVAAGSLDADGIQTFMDMFNQITHFAGEQMFEQNRKLVDLYIAPDIKPYTGASFTPDAIDSLLVRGERAARAQWDELIALKDKIGVPRDYDAEYRHGYGRDNTIHIRNIKFDGLNTYSAARIMKISGLSEYSVVTSDRIQSAVSRLQGTGMFTRVGYRFEGTSPYDVVFSVEESTRNSAGVGLRFDTEEMAAILLNVTMAVSQRGSAQLSLTGRLSENPYGHLALMFGNETSRKVSLSYMFKYNNLNVYHRGDKQSNLDFSQHTADLNYSNIRLHNFRAQLGIRYNYYHYRSLLSLIQDELDEARSQGIMDYYFSAQFENFDQPSQPTRGSSIWAGYNLYTSNFLTYKGHTPFAAAHIGMRSALSVSDRVTFLPSMFGRVLIGENIAYPTRNIMGGSVAGRYMPQQIPFVGINYFETFDNSILGAGLDFRVRMWSKNYISAKTNFAVHHNNFFDMFTEGRTLWGFGLAYSYSTFAGPIDVVVGWSERTGKVGVYFNLGHYF